MEEKHSKTVEKISPEVCWRMVNNLSKSGIRVMSADRVLDCMVEEDVQKGERARFLRFGARVLLEALTVIDDETEPDKNRHMEVKKKFAEM